VHRENFLLRNISHYFHCKGACTHTGFLPESDPAQVVEFFTRTGIAAAGGQFDFKLCVGFIRPAPTGSDTCLSSNAVTLKLISRPPAANPAPGLSSSSPAR